MTTTPNYSERRPDHPYTDRGRPGLELHGTGDGHGIRFRVVHQADTTRYQTALADVVGHWAMYALLAIVLGVGIGSTFDEFPPPDTEIRWEHQP